MDTLFWTQSNPDIEFTHTHKQFFKKYLYKLFVYAPGGRQIDHKMDSVASALLERARAGGRMYNYGGSWRDRIDQHYIKEADALFLEYLRHVKQTNKKVKFRIEEPNIQIYAADEADLQLIVKEFDPAWNKYIEELMHPENDACAEVLKAGAILVSTPHKYSHKVVIRDGRYNKQIKSQVLNYLESLGDLVKLSNGSLDMMTKPYESMWGVFFYTNDPSVTTFLSLISPGIIANIHELVPTK